MQRDFTHCPRTINTYGGQNGTKIGITYNNEKYMLKLPPKAKSNKNMSYTNSCISEYVACHIFHTLGIKTQETMLGMYKNKLAVICKDFTNEYTRLQEFAHLKNTIVDSEQNGYGTELSDILESIDEQQILPSDELKKHFWNMFIADALLGNFDRHNGNWGFLADMKEEKTSIAPVYDCGSCLYPQMDEQGMKNILKDKAEIEKRIFVFPTSAIKENNVKINYANFLMMTENKDCIEALQTIGSCIDMQAINNIIENTPYISDTHKEFLSTMIEERRANIIEPALKRFEQTITNPRRLPNCLDDIMRHAQKENDKQYE